MADKLAAALEDAAATTELFVNFKDGDVLDERVAGLVNLEELQLREVPPDAVLPEALLALPKLREVGITGQDDRLVMPALIGRLPIQTLAVWDATPDQLPVMPGLRRLSWVCTDPEADVAVIADRVPQLRELRVWGSHLETGELPDEIARFTGLEVLELVSCGVSTLPDALERVQTLRELELRGVPMTQLPDVVTRLAGLERLRVRAPLAGLPAAITALRRLRVLDLQGALNKGAMVSRWDDVSKLKPLPRVLSELTWLEELNLDHCGVVDAAPLAPLTALGTLSLAWSGIESVAPLAALTALESLSLESCDRIRDLSPLAALTRLRVLNLDRTRPRSLDVVRALPALAELHVESCESRRMDAIYDVEVDLHADDETREKYARRAALRALPPIAEIVARLGSPELAIVEAALAQLATWVDASSSRDVNATPAALGMAPARAPAQAEEDEGDDDDDDEDDELDDDDLDDGDDDDDDDDSIDEDGVAHTAPASGALPAIDAALERHLAALSPAVLAVLFGALFRTAEDDFLAAHRVASEIAARGDDAAQLAMVEAFIRALEYYDAGHRMHEDTVHDAMIEDVFPALRAPALARLLAWCGHDHLNEEGGGDAMLGLFEPALTRAGAAEREVLIARLERFVTDAMQYSGGPDVVDAVWQMLDRLPEGPSRAACDAMRDRVEVDLAAARARAAIEAQLESGAIEAVTAGVLAALALPPAQIDDLLGAMWSAVRTRGLGPGARRGLLTLCRRADRHDGMAWLLATAAHDLPIAELRADADVLGLEPGALGAVIREAILDGRDALPAATLDELRAWASELDGLGRDEALSGEVQALLYRSASRYDRDRFARAVEALAALDRYAPRDRRGEKPSELASMVAMQAEAHEWDELRVLARNLHKLGVSGTALERMLAQLVAVCQLAKDDDGHRALEALVPAEVTWDILAFNLACRAAVDGDRSKALARVRRALELGKSPTQFLDDADFAPYREDAEFLAILKEFE